MLLLALAAQASQPQPGELKTFGDWTVGCDNARACRAVALVPDGVDRDEYLLLVIDREGAPTARPELLVPPPSREDGVSDQVFHLQVDGKIVAGVSFLDPPPPLDASLADALANGREATLATKQGQRIALVSLKGLAAAMLYMDERQRRLGTRGALRRTGAKPDTSVPAPPPLPRIIQPAPASKPPRRLSPAAAAKLIGPDNATCEYAQGRVEPRAYRLDANHSLALVTHPCGNGAYNIMTSVYVLDEGGRASPARFDAARGFQGRAGNLLVNGDWDPQTRHLSEFPKARGLGDCGASSDYAWDGRRFRLVRSAAMGECRGSIDYVTTWRAEVVPAR